MDFDALLLLSFGGPEAPDQVRPFLENVTRGRGIPPERLDSVAEHYQHFGGVSPINGINRALIEQLKIELPDLPIYFGNRNWEPYVEDAVTRMRDDGIRRAAVLTTSAWGGYSSCQQYIEDIARGREAAGPDAPELVKLRQYYDHPLFVETFAANLTEAAARLPQPLRDQARVVFTAHSVPIAADERHAGNLYSRQVAYASRLVADAAGVDDYDQVWQSRSGPPRIPWLEPDIADHLTTLADAGTKAVIVCPIGFVADHIEVVWDLDTELAQQAEAAGVAMVRVATLNADRRYAQLGRELVDELRYGHPERRVASSQDPVPALGFSVNGALCSMACGRAQS